VFGFELLSNGVRVTVPVIAGATWLVPVLAAMAAGLLVRFILKLLP